MKYRKLFTKAEAYCVQQGIANIDKMEMLKAIRCNDVRRVQKKLQKGYEVNKPIHEYNKKRELVQTIPLCVAAARGHREIVEMLLSYGANIHACNLDWSSPLHMATFHGHVNIVRFLLQRNVNLNNSDQHGNTVLHLAATRNNFEAAVLFLDYNIDANIRNNTGQTALDIARLMNHHHIVETILEKLQIDTSLHEAANELLIRKQADNTSQQATSSDSSQKEKLQRQLHELEINEINATLKQKEFAYMKLSDDLENLDTEAVKLRTKITQLEGRLKDVNLKKLTKESEKKKLAQEMEKLKQKQTTHYRHSTIDNVKDYECPICFEIPLPPRKVYQCNNGHVYCSECKEKPGMSLCPQCRVPLNQKSAIRNIVYEEILAKRVQTSRGSLT